jgi:hypothetical protein
MSVYMIAHFYDFDKFAHTLIGLSKVVLLSKTTLESLYSHTSVASVVYLHYTKLWKQKHYTSDLS